MKHDFYLGIALEISKQATCLRGKVGAVIVKNDCICSTGYNGSARGLPSCQDVGCYEVDGHCCRTLHSEENAIIQASRLGVGIYGATMYCTHRPCQMCIQRIINVGITDVIYMKDYDCDYFYGLNYEKLNIRKYENGELKRILSK